MVAIYHYSCAIIRLMMIGPVLKAVWLVKRDLLLSVWDVYITHGMLWEDLLDKLDFYWLGSLEVLHLRLKPKINVCFEHGYNVWSYFCCPPPTAISVEYWISVFMPHSLSLLMLLSQCIYWRLNIVWSCYIVPPTAITVEYWKKHMYASLTLHIN